MGDKVTFPIEDTIILTNQFISSMHRFEHLAKQIASTDLSGMPGGGGAVVQQLNGALELLAQNAKTMLSASKDFSRRVTRLVEDQQRADESWGDKLKRHLPDVPFTIPGMPISNPDFLAGLADSAEGFKDAATLFGRMNPINTAYDISQGRTPAVLEFGAGLDAAVTHPLETLKAMTRYDLLKAGEYDRWQGAIAGDLAVAFATGGIGEVAEGSTAAARMGKYATELSEHADTAAARAAQLQADARLANINVQKMNTSRLTQSGINHVWDTDLQIAAQDAGRLSARAEAAAAQADAAANAARNPVLQGATSVMEFGERYQIALSVVKLDIPQTLTELISKFNEVSAAGNEAAGRQSQPPTSKDRR